MWITRKYENTLKSLFAQFPAVVVTGARQVGKTALVRHVFPETGYVSLDFPTAAAKAEQNPDDFFREFGLPLVIDEVQYAPSLFRHLKALIDSDRSRAAFFLLVLRSFLSCKEFRRVWRDAAVF